MKRFFIFVVVMMLFGGCGYKPSSTIASQSIGQKIYVKVDISKYEPINSVVLQDALNQAVIEQFKGALSTEQEASSKIFVKIASVNFLGIDYDADGYVTGYKTELALQSTYIDKFEKSHVLVTSGHYYFRINPNAIVSDTDRFEALKRASLKALSKLQYKIIQLGKQ